MLKAQKSTLLSKEAALAQREWYVIDLDGQILGRAATKIASVLRGKHKPTYAPHTDTGDFVIVVNASKVRLTGGKMQKKIYRDHTLYPGGLRETRADKMVATHPERMIEAAVWGMLPKGPLGRKILKKLKIYNGSEHNHTAQAPKRLELNQ